MATLILLGTMVYLIWGLAMLIRAGFVGEFNALWADGFNDPLLTPFQLACLILLMFFSLVWCWLIWPLTATWYRASKADKTSPPWWV